MIHENILGTIGNTPLVRINKVPYEGSAEVIAKLEFFNPGSSVKDRIAYSMITEAEKNGQLRQGMKVVEPTSGNTGIGLALVAAVKGYEVVFTMPETMSVERRKVLAQFGAEIILTPGKDGMNGAVEAAIGLCKQGGYFMPNQFENPANPKIHRETTAPEIIRGLDGLVLDYFVAGVGTGGTITGTGEVLKSRYPDIKLVAVEPKDSPVLSEGWAGPHKIQGIGANFVPGIYKPGLVDRIITVSNEDAFATSKRLAKEEGILAGISAGANLWAALQVAKEAGPGKRLVVIIPDTGERYLSTPLFE